MDAVRYIGWNNVAVAGSEVDRRFAAEEEKNFSFGYITDLLVRMLMRRVRLCLRSIVEVEDHQHQMIAAGNPALDAWTDSGHRQIRKFERAHLR